MSERVACPECGDDVVSYRVDRAYRIESPLDTRVGLLGIEVVDYQAGERLCGRAPAEDVRTVEPCGHTVSQQWLSDTVGRE